MNSSVRKKFGGHATHSPIGVVIAYWLDYGTSFYASSFQYRFPFAFQAVFAVLLILQIIGLPETPRWLVAHDRHEEARAVIASIRDRPLDDADVGKTLLDIQTGLEEENAEGPFRLGELFTWGRVQNLRRLLLIVSVQLGQQFSGSNMINYYLPSILQNDMGISRNLSLVLGGCAQCTYLVGSAIPVFLMDRYGRRSLLMWCSAGLCLCFVMVTILLSVGSAGAAYAAVAFIFVFQLCYGVGWLPVPWFYPSELATTRVRARMQAVASGWNWMAVFAVVKITPISFGKWRRLDNQFPATSLPSVANDGIGPANIGWKTFIIFAVLNACFIPMVYFFYPETKGIFLEDIPLLFSKCGFTGGVFSSRGRTVNPGDHALALHLDEKVVRTEEVENKVSVP